MIIANFINFHPLSITHHKTNTLIFHTSSFMIQKFSVIHWKINQLNKLFFINRSFISCHQLSSMLNLNVYYFLIIHPPSSIINHLSKITHHSLSFINIYIIHINQTSNIHHPSLVDHSQISIVHHPHSNINHHPS